MIPHSILVGHGKGGSGKTSVTAEVAAMVAGAGWKVLCVDFDPQGNLQTNLGYADRSDGGEDLADSVRRGHTPTPLTAIRDHLDVLAGGPHLEELQAHLYGLMSQGKTGDAARSVDRALAPLAEGYDLILIDTAPGRSLLHNAIYAAANYLLIPTKPDQASIDGLGPVALAWQDTRDTYNPGLELLGVVLFAVPSQATRTRADATAAIREILSGTAPVFDTVVRDSTRTAVDTRRDGISAAEYEHAAANDTPWWKDLREGRKKQRRSAAAGGVASDYQALTEEIIARMTDLDAPIDLTEEGALEGNQR